MDAVAQGTGSVLGVTHTAWERAQGRLLWPEIPGMSRSHPEAREGFLKLQETGRYNPKSTDPQYIGFFVNLRSI